MIYLFGCLPILLIILFVMAISLVGKTVERLGAIAVWLWDSFCNLFRTHKVETINPFTGESNFDAEPEQSDDISYIPPQQRPKRYDSSDGEYIEYQELP